MKGFFLAAALLLTFSSFSAPLRAADDDSDATKIYAMARQHLSKTKLTLVEAINAALKKHPGGHAVEAGFEAEGEDYDFVVEVWVAGKLHDVEVDAVSGKIESDELTKPEADEQAAALAVSKNKITLAKAVAAAVEEVGGKDTRAFDAGPHLENGKLLYEVGLLSGTDVYDVQVDATTGKVLGKKKVE